MTDNYMIRRAIPDLLNKKYYIPEYQRGYRWEKTQVLDLLQDLYAFFIGDTKGQFYCLQPIVVKEKQMNNELWYEVIDGQQRLTTIRIIMQIYDQLNSNMFTAISHKYTIMYATRPDMVDIFESIKIAPPTASSPATIDEIPSKWSHMIDSVYIYHAAKTVLKWFMEDLSRVGVFSQYFYQTADSGTKSVQVVSMCRFNHEGYRYYGVINGSWQNFTGYHKFGSRNRIMEVFDLIDTSVPVSTMVGCTKSVCPENWRYYAVKYAGEITVAYRSTDYGYLYFQRAEEQNSFDPNASSLDVCILQSGYFSATNVAWKMLNRLVELLSQEKYYIYLDNHGGSPIILSRISNDVRLDIEIDGWHLYGISSDVLQDLGIAHTIVGTPSGEGDNDINQQANTVNCLCYHNNGSDYVEEAIALLGKLSIKYPDMLVVK